MDRPMIFSAPMVRALIREAEAPGSGKTQTRRVFVPPAPWAPGDDITVELATGNIAPKWAAGDRLWIKEATHRHTHKYVYSADEAEVPWPGRQTMATWTRDIGAAMFLPRAASRLTLHVTDVRVERLQDISEADAKAEGVTSRLAKG